MNRIADMGQEFTNWLRTYKNIARWIGYAVGALISFTGLTAALTLMSGIVSAIGVAFAFLTSPVMLTVGAVVALGVVIYKFRAQFMQFVSGFATGFKQVGVSLDPVFRAFDVIWQAIQKVWSSIMRVISAIFGAGDAVNYFSNLGEALGIYYGFWFDSIISGIEHVANMIGIIADVFSDVADAVIEAWQGVIAGWRNSDPIQIFSALGNGIKKVFTSIFNGLKNLFISTYNWIVSRANKLSSLIGIEIPLIPTIDENTTPEVSAALDLHAGSALPTQNMPPLQTDSIGSQLLQNQLQLSRLVGVNTAAKGKIPETNLITQNQPLYPPTPEPLNTMLQDKKLNPMLAQIPMQAVYRPPTLASASIQPTYRQPSLPDYENVLKRPQSGKLFELDAQMKPQYTQIKGGSVSKNITTTQTVDRSIKIQTMTVQANDPREFIQMQRDSQQLAAG